MSGLPDNSLLSALLFNVFALLDSHDLCNMDYESLVPGIDETSDLNL